MTVLHEKEKMQRGLEIDWWKKEIWLDLFINCKF